MKKCVFHILYDKSVLMINNYIDKMWVIFATKDSFY